MPGLIKFSLNRQRGDSALFSALLTLYLASIVGDWSLSGGYNLNLYFFTIFVSKKIILMLGISAYIGYVYYDLNIVWPSEQLFNANNHPFQAEFEIIKAELAEIKKKLEPKQDKPIRAFWQEPNGC